MSDSPVLINEAGDVFVPQRDGNYVYRNQDLTRVELLEAVDEELFTLTGVHLALYNLVARFEQRAFEIERLALGEET